MRRLITLCAAAVLILSTGSAQAVMYDFDAITVGTYIEADFSSFFPGEFSKNTPAASFSHFIGEFLVIKNCIDFSGKILRELLWIGRGE